ncbi:patched domain-containing protein 3-like [Mercenaria mercenaria]|uniref:patched domain-containing protein 3-like n=1 Tax=Mercenaria mercenaria TaxID=6596 RepID=UPI00234ECF1B|nr:patched domain-containing protein 3-like [Mercenaria mercenaria]
MHFRDTIESSFGTFAYYIACHAWKVCVAIFLCNALLGLGLLNSLTCNNENIYLPSNTQTQDRMEILLNVFGDQIDDDFYSHRSIRPHIYADLIIVRKDIRTLINSSLYDEINFILDHVKRISVNASSANNNRVTYQDVCARMNGKCVIDGEGILERNKSADARYLQMPMDKKFNLITETFAVDKKFNLVTETFAKDTNENKTFIAARDLRFRFYLRRDVKSKLWMDRFITEMQSFTKTLTHNDFRVVFSHTKSFFEELSKDSKKDIRYFSLSFTVYFIYIGFVLSGGNSLTNRANIGRMGIIVTPVSILGAWGVLAASNVMYTDIVGIIPFFVVCHQIINVMLTLSHLSDTYGIADGKDRVKYAIQKSIIPVTTSVICHILPFAVGLMSSFYVIKQVSMYIVTTLLFNYLNHIVFYTACLAIHERRIDAGRHYCICTKLKSRDLTGNCCFLCCCTGSKPIRRSDTESKLQTNSGKGLFHLMSTASMQFIAVVSCIAVIAFAILGLMNNFYCDVIQANEVLPGSYFYDWNEMTEGSFEKESTVQIAIAHPFGYTNDRALVSDLVNTITSTSSLKTKSLLCWQAFVNKNDTEPFNSEAVLVRSVRSQLIQKYPFTADDIVFDDLKNKIVASRIYIKVGNISSTSSIAKVQTELNEISFQFNRILQDKHKNLGLKSVFPKDKFVIVYSPDFLFTDGYMRPLLEMIVFLAVQCSLLFLLSILFSRSICQALATPFCYVSMVTCIAGLSSYFSIYLCQVSMLFYTISGCYCVEVLVQSGISVPNGSSQNMQDSFNRILNTVVQSLLHAMVGQFIAIFLLLLAESFFFVTVFRLTITTTGVCIITSILWLPKLMSHSAKCNSTVDTNSTEAKTDNSTVAVKSGDDDNIDTHFATKSMKDEPGNSTVATMSAEAEKVICAVGLKLIEPESGKNNVTTKLTEAAECRITVPNKLSEVEIGDWTNSTAAVTGNGNDSTHSMEAGTGTGNDSTHSMEAVTAYKTGATKLTEAETGQSTNITKPTTSETGNSSVATQSTKGDNGKRSVAEGPTISGSEDGNNIVGTDATQPTESFTGNNTVSTFPTEARTGYSTVDDKLSET